MASELNIHPIPAFTDNYIWCLHDGHSAVVVDPGDASPVFSFIESNGLELIAILITHHHADHTGGIRELSGRYPDTKVYGPQNPSIKGITERLGDGDQVNIESLDLSFSVMSVPGHTLDHIAYYQSPWLFCGDTLFSAGCGRLFEGTPEQMFNSLQRLSALPDSTQVYCTHEYTLSNLDFANKVHPDNTEINEAIQAVRVLRQENKPSLPSSIGREKSINPFLMTDVESSWKHISQNMEHNISNELEAFTAIRSWKDSV